MAKNRCNRSMYLPGNGQHGVVTAVAFVTGSFSFISFSILFRGLGENGCWTWWCPVLQVYLVYTVCGNYAGGMPTPEAPTSHDARMAHFFLLSTFSFNSFVTNCLGPRCVLAVLVPFLVLNHEVISSPVYACRLDFLPVPLANPL